MSDQFPTILFDGNAVFEELKRDAVSARRTSPENVSDVLDAIVRIIKTESERTVGTEFKRGAELLIDDYPCRVTADNRVELPAMKLDTNQMPHLVAWLQEVSPK